MKKHKSEDAETEAIMQEGVTQTLELAKENGITLDFSDESINEVEKFLAECHREYKKVKSEEGFHGLAMMFGAYIGEVIKRKGFGGSWARNHPQMGEDSFPFFGVTRHCFCMPGARSGYSMETETMSHSNTRRWFCTSSRMPDTAVQNGIDGIVCADSTFPDSARPRAQQVEQSCRSKFLHCSA